MHQYEAPPDLIREFQSEQQAPKTENAVCNGRSGLPPVACYEDAILEAGDFISIDIPEKETYLHPWLTEQSIVFIIAPRGVGKTQFCMGVADAITKQISFGPWQARKAVNCLFLDGEMACPDVIRRLQDLGTSGRKARLLVYCDAYAHTKGLPRASLLNPKWCDFLLNFMLKNDVKVWVCDNVASLTPGIDENSKEAWDPVNQWLLKLRFSGISTILVHHEGKGGNQRGTSAREDNIDIAISLKKPSDYLPEQGARFIASFTKSRIPLEHLSLITDTEFQLMKVQGDVYEWVWKNVKKQNKVEVLRMFDDGVTAKEIAQVLGISGARVSQIKAEAIREGLLSKKGNLTQFGFNRLEA